MNYRLTRTACAVALLAGIPPALAQQAESKAGGAERAVLPATDAGKATSKAIERVEVKGRTQAYDPRREDTASKVVLTREEIIKYGDTNVFDVLKRAPGVTVIGNSIRMRGLGNGYTQILVNGERPPPGFSMESVTPEQIEKVEVIRSATAEHSMQAIAGTVNIVLKKVVAKPERDLRINGGRSDQSSNRFIAGTWADRADNLSYYVTPTLYYGEGSQPGTSTERVLAPNGQVVQQRDMASHSRNHTAMLGLQARLNWKLPDDGQLNVSGYAQTGRSGYWWQALTTNRIGSFGDPDYVDRITDSSNRSLFGGAEVNWVVKLLGGKLDAKLSTSRGRNNTANRRPSATADHVIVLHRDIDGRTRYTNYGTTGKYTRTLFDGHAMASGWEASSNLTEDDAVRVEGLVGGTQDTIHEWFRPKVVKLAVYAQDEWNVAKDWSVYAGARWEAIRTASSGAGLADTRSNTHVLSPVAQTLYKFPDQSGRQLRMALTRTFKAPQTYQLTARRYLADLNTRFSPDSSGNPNLKPELANGIDVTYEHFWAPGAVFSVGASQRRIRNFIRALLVEDRPGHWLDLPMNEGDALVRTVDVEVKFPLKSVAAGALPLDYRFNVNRNWSRVDAVPGPDNRLDKQIPLTATLGVDYRDDKIGAGASLAYRGGGLVRQSVQQFVRQQGRRELEAYGLYKVRTGLQWRLSVSNALGEDNRGESRYVDRDGASETRSWTPESIRLQANVEMKF